ncbi:MAG: hypothetical protein HDR77_08265 [Bacteroides sp.]|nr:hypothetical protein [Bacteroides sp.]
MKTDYPMAVNVIRLQAYLLPPDEAVFFDWLMVKAAAFGFKPFYYSYKRIYEELRINRTRLDTILRKFVEMGIVEISVKGDALARTKVTHFNVSLECVLNNLPQIINAQDTEYFEYWRSFLSNGMSGKKSKKPTKTAMKLAEEAFSELVKMYNNRIKMYNNGELTGEKPKRKMRETSLPKSDSRMKKIAYLTQMHGTRAVCYSFTAFADAVLKGDIGCAHPLDYFLKHENGFYPVFDKYLDEFNESYRYE